jgi:RNA polymerase sigma factor (sigma-70 family)
VHERHPQLPKEEVKRLLRELRRTEDPALRARLIEAHLGLVEYLARRFAGRGEPLDDLIQLGTVGLVKAVDRFDPTRDVEFSTYATPTIVGELKRHFRDKGWAVRVPRRLQELNLKLGPVIGTLSQELQRSPTVAEIAKAAEATQDEILEAFDSAHAYSLISLDASAGSGEEGLSYHDQIVLRIPASTPHISMARATASALAARCDFTYDRITDLHIPNDETCSRLMAATEPRAERLEITFRVDGTSLLVSARAEAPVKAGGVLLNVWSETILKSVTDEFRIEEQDGRATLLFRVGRGETA